MKFPSLQEQQEELMSFLRERENIVTTDFSLVASPYRICPLGAHIDHQGGPVLGMTINACTLLAFMPKRSPLVRLHSINFPGVVEFNLREIPPSDNNGWGRYARGAAKVLDGIKTLRHGFIGAVSGMLPASGLSSSASVGLAYLYALAKVNDISLSGDEFVQLDRRLENDYLGLQNGILDPATIVHGRKGNLLHINTCTGVVRAFPWINREGFRILVACSGFSRELTSSGFNNRVEECRQAAKVLGEAAGTGPANILSDVPLEVFESYHEVLPTPLRRRALHFYSEVQRVEEGIKFWQTGDLEAFGCLMNESCLSSVYRYESGSPALQSLHEIVSDTSGVYGSRFSGGGYGGCVIGFVKSDFAEEAARHIHENYLCQYPEAKGRAAVYIASSDDGVRFL